MCSKTQTLAKVDICITPHNPQHVSVIVHMKFTAFVYVGHTDYLQLLTPITVYAWTVNDIWRCSLVVTYWSRST